LTDMDISSAFLEVAPLAWLRGDAAAALREFSLLMRAPGRAKRARALLPNAADTVKFENFMGLFSEVRP